MCPVMGPLVRARHLPSRWVRKGVRMDSTSGVQSSRIPVYFLIEGRSLDDVLAVAAINASRWAARRAALLTLDEPFEGLALNTVQTVRPGVPRAGLSCPPTVRSAA